MTFRASTIAVALLLAGCGGDAPDGLKVAGYTVDSRAVGKQMAVKVVLPEGGGEGRPLLVFLHGRGGDEGTYLHGPFFDALAGLGRTPRSWRFPTATRTRSAPATTRSRPRCAAQARTRPSAPGPAATTASTGTPTWRDYLRFYARALRRC